jgi:hypothetical protein
MMMRFSAAAMAVAFVCLAGTAQARPYFGYDGRHFGEMVGEMDRAPNYGLAPNFGRAGKELVHGTGDRKGLTAPMLAMLDRIETEFGPVNVISGYRPGAVIATTGRTSRHASGNAVDIEVGSRKAAMVKWLIANHHTGGTMTYSDMSHIHVDIGQHFVSLGSNSGTGGGGGGSRRYADYDSPRRTYGGERYAARYDSYDRGGYERSYGGGYGGGRSYGGSSERSYSGGYATIYN